MTRTSELEYDLPPELIATTPAEPRDSCRLMVVSRSDDALCEHRRFSDIKGYLRAGDQLVFNTTTVLPARIQGVRRDSGGRVEGLYLESAPSGQWRVALKSNGKLRPGIQIELNDHHGSSTAWSITLSARDGDEWLVNPVETDKSEPSDLSAKEILARVGATPLPPYILHARKSAGDDVNDDLDRDWYQTIYADRSAARSVAAPTAGLHFTPSLLESIAQQGVERTDLVLDVGQGTFKPVGTETVEAHPIHSERFNIGPEALEALIAAREQGNRIIPVGTTGARALESLPADISRDERSCGVSRETSLLIAPGYEWRWCHGLITNFHLPRSTLLALVAALLPGGVDRLIELYQEAIERRYRFYSYGDAMLILP